MVLDPANPDFDPKEIHDAFMRSRDDMGPRFKNASVRLWGYSLSKKIKITKEQAADLIRIWELAGLCKKQRNSDYWISLPEPDEAYNDFRYR